MSTALALRYMSQSKALRDRGRTVATRSFLTLPAYNDETFADWLAMAGPVSDATAEASAALASSFLSTVTGIGHDGALDFAAYTQGAIGVQPFETRYRDPFISVWNHLGKGERLDEARAAGASRAGLIVDEDAQWAATRAMRDTATKAAQAGRRVHGYRRIPEARACSFCRLVASRPYNTADLAPVHAGCGCGVEPLIA